MKNLFLIILFLFSFLCNAQIEKGRFMIGGSISPYYSKNIYSTYNFYESGLNSNVKAGYFIFKNFVLGINESEDIRGSKEKNSGYQYNFQAHGLGLFTRYYFLNFKKISLFGEGKFGVLVEKTKYKENSFPSQSSTNNAFNYSGSIGLNYFVTHNVALELSVNYNYMNPTSKSSSNNVLSPGIPNVSTTSAFIGFLIFL